MVVLLTPLEILPRAWAPYDASDALAFWLTNPLLLHHYAPKMALTVEKAAGLTDNAEKLLLVWKLREMRLICRTRKALPEGLPGLDTTALAALCARIDDSVERGEVRSFGLRLHDCERPWLAARIEAVLAARAAEPAAQQAA